jgi:hypothetical protein
VDSCCKQAISLKTPDQGSVSAIAFTAKNLRPSLSLTAEPPLLRCESLPNDRDLLPSQKALLKPYIHRSLNERRRKS